MKRNLFLISLLFFISSFSSIAKEDKAETCSVLASQYRFYSEGYKNQAEWVPNSPLPKSKSEKMEGSIFDSVMYAHYYNTNGVSGFPQKVVRSLIEFAYTNHLRGHSISFGQFYVFLNCMDLVVTDPINIAHCDMPDLQINNEGMKQFFSCAVN